MAGKLLRTCLTRLWKQNISRAKNTSGYKTSDAADARSVCCNANSWASGHLYFILMCIYKRTAPALFYSTRFVYKPLFRRKCLTRNFSKRKSVGYLHRGVFIATIYRRKGFRGRMNQRTIVQYYTYIHIILYICTVCVNTLP